MPGSFISALGALRAHQSWLDVIGNNLANTNTPGFKTSRALFSDLLSITRRPGTPPTTAIGGTNPIQVGLGVQLAQVDRSTNQGALDVTGRTFDMAILGDGFFALNDGEQNLYSRVGSFGIDANGDMVDIRTGFRVLDNAGQRLNIDTSAVSQPAATTNVRFAGNLPAVITGPLAEQLTSSSSFQEGTEALMTGSVQGPFNIPAGDTWTMELTINGGAPEEVSIAGSGAITAQEIADEINAQTDHVTATVTPTGEIELVSDRAGLDSTIKVDAGETGKDLKALIGLSDFVQGTEDPATLTTDLSSLSSNLADYVIGDSIEVAGTQVDGTPVVASFTYGVDGTTVGDLVSFVDELMGQSTVSFNQATGQIQVLADETGEAELSLSISDGSNQTGSTNWAEHFFSVTTNGTGPDVVSTSLEVFNNAGVATVLTVDFTRQDDGSWTAEGFVPPLLEGDDPRSAGTIAGIQFNEDGSYSFATDQLQFTIPGNSPGEPSQTISLDFGQQGSFEGLTQFGSPSSVASVFQDGYGAGELSSILVDPEGFINGFFTNGQTLTLGNVGIARFGNQAGLEEIGDNFFRESANSGTRTLSQGAFRGAGEVVAGALEGSNVDTAEEFVHLIEAQRGFQANARVITVQDEIFAEIVNII